MDNNNDILTEISGIVNHSQVWLLEFLIASTMESLISTCSVITCITRNKLALLGSNDQPVQYCSLVEMNVKQSICGECCTKGQTDSFLVCSGEGIHIIHNFLQLAAVMTMVLAVQCVTAVMVYASVYQMS